MKLAHRLVQIAGQLRYRLRTHRLSGDGGRYASYHPAQAKQDAAAALALTQSAQGGDLPAQRQSPGRVQLPGVTGVLARTPKLGLDGVEDAQRAIEPRGQHP